MYVLTDEVTTSMADKNPSFKEEVFDMVTTYNMSTLFVKFLDSSLIWRLFKETFYKVPTIVTWVDS